MIVTIGFVIEFVCGRSGKSVCLVFGSCEMQNVRPRIVVVLGMDDNSCVYFDMSQHRMGLRNCPAAGREQARFTSLRSAPAVWPDYADIRAHCLLCLFV